MGSELCSARIESLAGFAQAGLQGRVDMDAAGRVAAAGRDWDAMVAACAFRAVEGNPGPELTSTLDQFRDNEAWVRGIATALENAPVVGGVSTLSSGEVAAALAAAGAAPDTGTIAFDPQEIVGSPVTSGLVNDPVNAATGNFVHADRDLRFPGFGAVLDVVRVYNSFNAGRVGAFGRGWTSPLDVALDVGDATAGVVRLRFTDGAVVPFAAGPDGAWLANARRRMVLERTAAGWRVSRHNGRRCWYFDPDGTLTGGEELAAAWTVTRDRDHAVTWAESRSGRWVRYQLSDGLVGTVTTSDGRRCRYRYDGHGNCTGVERAIGDLTYEVGADGFLAALFDADGVALFRNHYDERGRVVAQDAPHGRSSRMEYLDHGATRVIDDADGGAANLLYHDPYGNLTALFGADGAVMRAVYDHHGRLVRHVDRAGGVTSYQHHPDVALDLITARVDPDGLQETRDHDARGRLVARTDRSGATYRYRYDGDEPNPSAILAPEGVSIAISHDERGLPVAVTDGDGVTTRFGYDGDGQLVVFENGAGETTRFTYDPTGQLTSVTDPAGHTVTFELDTSGRVRSVTDVAGSVRAFRNSPAGRVLAMSTDGPGSWQAVYGHHGDLVAFTDATGATVGFEHDRCGHVSAITAPDGSVTTQTWDGLGLLTAVTDPAGNTATQSHDRAGRPVTVTHYDGRTWRRQVDALGRTTALTGPDGAVTSRTYHPDGQLASVTLPDGATWSYEIDGLGRLTAEVDPDGGRRTFEYSPASRLLRQTTPAGRVHTYRYDRAGRLTAVTDPDGVNHEATIGPDGRLTTLAVGGNAVDVRFDQAGRVVAWHDGDERSSATLAWGTDGWSHHRGDDAPARFDYDLRGLLDRVSDPAGILTRFEHDLRGRVVGAATADQDHRIRYEASGAVAATSDGNGLTVTYRNSPAGRLERLLFGDSGLGRSFTWDRAGRLAAVADLEDLPLVGYRYDRAGHLAAATVPRPAGSGGGRNGSDDGHNGSGGDGGSGRVDLAGTGGGGRSTVLERDRQGQLVAVIDPTAGTARYQRDPDGMVVRRTEGDGAHTTFLRTPAGRLVGFLDSEAGEVARPAGPAATVRDRAGRITDDGQGRSYRYDHAGRLELATAPDGSTRRYTWNDLGLLATDVITTPEGTRRRRFTWNLGGQLIGLTADGSHVAYTYDQAGRRVEEAAADGSRVVYRWNALDQLVGVEWTGPDGRTTSRRFTWNGLGRVVAVDDTTIGWDDVITGKPVRVGPRRYLRSGLSVRPATAGGEWHDGTGDDPFGPVEREAGIRLGYRGELTVDGLVLMGDRVYDPATRAFLSKDPLPPRPGANAAFSSPYAYAWCDPVNFVDPTGRQPVSIEEFNAWKERQESNRFERAGQAMLDDPWGSLAMVGVVAVGVGLMATGVGGPIGAGILIGAAASAATGLATDNFNPRAVALGGAFGAIPGANTVSGAFAAGFTQNLTSQVLIDGRGLDNLDYGAALLDGTIGAVIPAAGNRLAAHLPTGTIDDVVPAGTGNPVLTMDQYVAQHPNGWDPPASVSVGGRPDGATVFSGHGALPVGGGHGEIFQVPSGTSIATYGNHDTTILDSLGRRAELGNPTPTRIYGPGEVMPNYTLFPPANLNIASLSTTVAAPTRLSDLVGPDGGTVHWAACLEELDWLTW